MDDIKRKLRFILKRGDIYDLVKEKDHKRDIEHSAIYINLLAFSRILFGLTLICRRIKNYFAPLEKVKQYQDDIRKKLGLNIDIVKGKNQYIRFTNSQKSIKLLLSTKKLAVLYKAGDISGEKYLTNLDNLLHFCEIYNIDNIILLSDELNRMLEIDLKEYESCSLAELFSFILLSDKEQSNDYVILSIDELKEIIGSSSKFSIDNRFIKDIFNEIEDNVVKQAILKYLKDGDLRRLREIALKRLEMLANANGTYIAKNYGKLHADIKISGEYVNIKLINEDGIQISNNVESIYDYLQLNYDTIIREIKKNNDNKELLCLAALHLYLNKHYKTQKDNEDSLSFYDRMYFDYHAKKSKNINYIYPDDPSCENKFYSTCMNLEAGLIITLILLYCSILAGISYEYLTKLFFNKDIDLESYTKPVVSSIESAYFASAKLEFDLVGSAIKPVAKVVSKVPFIDKILEKMNFDPSFISGLAGDVSNEPEDETLAYVHSLNGDPVPYYFSSGYATTADYNWGNINYEITTPTFSFATLVEVEPAFSVEIPIDKHILKSFISDCKLKIPLMFCPVGGNYVPTKLIIYDEKQPTNEFRIDGISAINISNNTITNEEKNNLLEMEKPIICFYYGLTNYLTNYSGVKEENINYLDILPEDARDAITTGLDLDEDASLDVIYQAIKNKNYSKTPIKDAGLSWKIKLMSESKYLESIASMDSLVCNLAATLAVFVTPNSTYHVGFYTNDNVIKSNEAHAWAMSYNNEIIDLTPKEIEEQEIADKIEEMEIISNIINFGIVKNLSLFVMISLISVIFYKKFGKKITFNIHLYSDCQMLLNSNINEAYAQIINVLFGNNSIPVKRNSVELVDRITKEIGNLNKEELRELQKILKKENSDPLSGLLAKEIPFIVENEVTIYSTSKN